MAWTATSSSVVWEAARDDRSRHQFQPRARGKQRRARSPACDRGRQGNARHPTLPRAVAFWLVAGVLFLLFFAAAAPSPLYGVYQARWRFSATTLTVVFAAYALLLLV